MIFLGNPDSRHLDTWRKLYKLRGQTITRFCSIHPLQDQYPIETRIAWRGKPLSYVLLGLALRREGRGGEPLHAHGASGYGLSALLSGRPFIVTVYGSELLHGRGKTYLAMVRAIFRAARAITVTSRTARDRVIQLCPTLADKTHLFHTGVDLGKLALVADAVPEKHEHKLVQLMCIRNCASHYRTVEVLDALRTIVADVAPFRVIVPLGNGDPDYFARLRRDYPDPWIQYIDDIIPNEAFLTLMRNVDICVNFPLSDQTSATLLEALYLDRVIVTCNLEAYEDLLKESVGCSPSAPMAQI